MFLRKRPEVPVDDFRTWVDDTLVPGLAASAEVLKLRRHLFEELDITLDHPGVTMTKPMDRQYQAMVEVVVADEDAFARFTAPTAYQAVAGELARMCAAVHPARVQRCITTKHDGRITLAGCARCRRRRHHPQARRDQPDPRRRLARVPPAHRPRPQLTAARPQALDRRPEWSTVRAIAGGQARGCRAAAPSALPITPQARGCTAPAVPGRRRAAG